MDYQSCLESIKNWLLAVMLYFVFQSSPNDLFFHKATSLLLGCGIPCFHFAPWRCWNTVRIEMAEPKTMLTFNFWHEVRQSLEQGLEHIMSLMSITKSQDSLLLLMRDIHLTPEIYQCSTGALWTLPWTRPTWSRCRTHWGNGGSNQSGCRLKWRELLWMWRIWNVIYLWFNLWSIYDIIIYDLFMIYVQYIYLYLCSELACQMQRIIHSPGCWVYNWFFEYMFQRLLDISI